jgi:hypothetical protein
MQGSPEHPDVAGGAAAFVLDGSLGLKAQRPQRLARLELDPLALVPAVHDASFRA